MLPRRFGEFTAVDELSLDIYEREFFALLAAVGLRQDHTDADARRLRDSPARARSLLDGQTRSGVPPTGGR